VREPTNWDNYSSYHRGIEQFFFGFANRAYSRLLRKARFPDSISLLEFGCGTGLITHYLSGILKPFNVTVIEKNAKMLEIAKETLRVLSCEKVFIEEDFFLHTPDARYDLVHSQGVVEHFDHETRLLLLQKHYDATKPGGYCIVFFPTPSFFYSFFRVILKILGTWYFHDEVPIGKETIIDEMKSLGFIIEKTDAFWRLYLKEIGILCRRAESPPAGAG
jgi:SAM-dependent methyltransferase